MGTLRFYYERTNRFGDLHPESGGCKSGHSESQSLYFWGEEAEKEAGILAWSCARRESESHCWYLRVHQVLGYMALHRVQVHGALYLFLFPLTIPPPLTGSVPKSKAPGTLGPPLAGLRPQDAFQHYRGPTGVRSPVPRTARGVGGGVQPPGSRAGPWPASGCQQGRGGALEVG